MEALSKPKLVLPVHIIILIYNSMMLFLLYYISAIKS